MAESKFSGVLAKLREQPKELPEEVSETVETPTVRGRGRPSGKRSNPDYQPTTILIRKQTKKSAARLLEDKNDERDLSELIDDLLVEWVEQNS
jgi:hypothetical protein